MDAPPVRRAPHKPAGRFDLRWSRRNLAALAILCVAAIMALALDGERIEIGRTPAVFPQRIAAVSQKINPNTATVASMRRLGGIGPKTAQAIVDYRQAHRDEPFVTCDDLRRVKGIGPKTVQRLARQLTLGGDR